LQGWLFNFGVRYLPGEPVFVPKSADAAENDGWLLALRYDRELDRSDLVVLDANDFEPRSAGRRDTLVRAASFQGENKPAASSTRHLNPHRQPPTQGNMFWVTVEEAVELNRLFP
jgi:hypothetical protein